MVSRVSTAVLVLVVGVAAISAGAHRARAQETDAVPRISNAELMFEQGVAAFERGRYEKAYERFRLAAEYELNRKTTAALLMSGKALVRLGRYQEAVDQLETLLDRFPETTYRQQAESVIELARNQLQLSRQPTDTLRIGVALPMGDEQVALSQALFNGIRLAVEKHNGVRRRYVRPEGLRGSDESFDVYDTAQANGDSLAETEGHTTVATSTDTVRLDSLRVVNEQVKRPEWVARLFFRQTGSSPRSARAAVDSLVRLDDVDVIVGPIRSEMARPAARQAEQDGVLLVAPLATHESVSEGRHYVFQANPTIVKRGRIMGQFAVNGLLLDRVAVVYDTTNSISRRMATGFRQEAKAQNLEMPFTLALQNSQDWSRLPAVVDEDSTLTDSLLAQTQAFYLPVGGRGTAGKIEGALTGLRQVASHARVLGNSEWHDVPFMQAATEFTTTYTNDFYVQTDRESVQQFIRRYRLLTGTTPDELSADGRRLAYAGYDVAAYLLSELSPSTADRGAQVLRAAPAYEGLGTRIHFQGGNVNGAMFIHRYRNQQIELLR